MIIRSPGDPIRYLSLKCTPHLLFSALIRPHHSAKSATELKKRQRSRLDTPVHSCMVLEQFLKQVSAIPQVQSWSTVKLIAQENCYSSRLRLSCWHLTETRGRSFAFR